MKLETRYNGEWHFPRRRNYLLQCCDCGLIHKINFKLVKLANGGRQIGMQAFRITKKEAKRILGK